jgi:threonyl-tRNA synthetase
MLHRAILGTLERFIGVYLEHIAGHLPTWLSPVQVTLLNVTDRVNSYCEEIQNHLRQQKVRVEFDRRNEKLNFKIREAQLQKIPYMIIVGDKEMEERKVSIRLRTGENINNLTLDQAFDLILGDIKNRNLNPGPTATNKQEVSH